MQFYFKATKVVILFCFKEKAAEFWSLFLGGLLIESR
ncbi:hypothetical protein SGRA_0141 [Saprospira grandis str. Lewin]|uniref:Uncharacterized protein n=1 Tax=Saprospira grandis (strain Lewin) TaxID=984262 RepID=H6L513_SAPGL|nr:hypothetical protein SGRA_0141 [Saprospira grandis str. Lewin]